MCTLQSNKFKEYFPKGHRPEIDDLAEFWNNGTDKLFNRFAEYIRLNYDLRFGVPIWSNASGWTYRVDKSGVYLIKGIQISEKGFIVDGILVCDSKSYNLALDYIKTLYQQCEFDFKKKIAEVNERQAERNKKRISREKEELYLFQEKIDPARFNIFNWPKKLDINKLTKLYKLDAKGIHDEVLVDEVGLSIYIRCKYGKEDMNRMEKFIIRCHNCNNEINGTGDFRQCDCGYQYSYREYRRSYRRNNMPTGAVSKVFDKYIVSWRAAREYSEKMILVDTLLHEFHLSMISGVTHRPMAMNFIDGSRKHVVSVLDELAGEM